MEILKELTINENGQGFAEYALILSGITLVVFVAVFILGGQLSQYYDGLKNREDLWNL